MMNLLVVSLTAQSEATTVASSGWTVLNGAFERMWKDVNVRWHRGCRTAICISQNRTLSLLNQILHNPNEPPPPFSDSKCSNTPHSTDSVVTSATLCRIRFAFRIKRPDRRLRTRGKPSVATGYHGTHTDQNWTKIPSTGTAPLRRRGRCSSHTHWTGCFPHQRKLYIILWKEVSLLISPHRRLAARSPSRGDKSSSLHSISISCRDNARPFRICTARALESLGDKQKCVVA
jgi:hypothetical protein